MVTKLNIIQNGKSASFDIEENADGSFILASDYEALKADRDAQQKRADALAVENANQRDWMNKCSELWGAGCDLDNLFVLMPETPATSAALAAIEARGVEKFAEATIAIGEQEKEESIIYAGKQAMLFAKQLREAK